MNKDLDERLVPQGEYRDALNVSVSYSEGSDVGALQNILGNTERAGGLTFPSGATCIGTVRDTENDKVYWFGTSSTADYIAELDPSDNSVDIILCDTGSILNFSVSNLITGVAVLDGILYFTDDLNEPRQVDIEYWRGVTATDFTTSTNLSADRISLYKKGPLNAPTFHTLSASTRGGVGTQGGSSITTTLNLSDSGGTGGTLGDAKDSGSTVSGTFSGAPNYESGDIIVLEYTHTNSEGIETITEARIKLPSGYTAGSTSFTNAEILTISLQVTQNSVAYSAILEEDDALFELKFPKFAYRYKFTNGQYSTMSPFSNAAFLTDTFNYDSEDAYNLGMVNTVRVIKLEGYPISQGSSDFKMDIEEIEILYKDSVSPNVYIVDSIKELSGTFASPFEIKDEQIYKATQSNQILRQFDSIPRKAKALEITGNRLIFGNYTQNFNYANTPSFEIKLKNRFNPGNTNTKESIKSLRTYQFGVVYYDEFGRSTPVFTDKSGVIKVPFNSAKNNTKFTATISGSIPSVTNLDETSTAFTSYKYFIKEVSNGYYNIAVSNFYEDEEGYVYVAFPSAEVNKVSEEDILILKKKTGDDPVQTYSRYKVLEKTSNTPNFLANQIEVNYNPQFTRFAQSYGSGAEQTTKKAGFTPVAGHNTIQLNKMFIIGDTAQGGAVFTDSSQGVSTQAITALSPGKKVRFVRPGSANTSKVYTIESMTIESSGNEEVEVTFEEQFGDDVEVIYHDSTDNSGYSCLLQGVEEVDNSGAAEYQGKFFVKLKSDTNLLNDLTASNELDNLNTLATGILYSSTSPAADREYFIVAGGADDSHTIPTSSPSVGGFSTYHNNASYGNFNLTGFHLGISTGEYFTDSESLYGSDPFGNNIKVGNYVKFTNSTDGLSSTTEEINFKIEEVKEYYAGGNVEKYWFIKFDRNLPEDIVLNSSGDSVTTDIREVKGDKKTAIINPAIFETETEDSPLEIYYETEEVFTSVDHGSENSLSFFNCYSFGNGVESDRIRDDFNAPTIGKGVRVSTVFEDNYKEERVKSGLIFSGIYNGKNGINRLNQFIIAENITEEANPIYGGIQKLNTRDTDLTLLCDDKILKVPARKDLLFQADGNPQVTSTDRFLGTIIPYAGNYGCQHPESFADHIYRAYFVDRTRGKVLRLSGDGITEISNYGMKDYFKDKLVAETGYMFGSYDENKDKYNISLPVENTVVSFSEGVNGWPTRLSFHEMESGISLNNMYYTFKDGKIFSHDNKTRNTFYGTKTNSKVTFYLNGNPGNAKNFRTLNYQGDSGWTSSSISTDKQTGDVSSFIEKEDIYYNYISGETQATKASLDLKALNVQGLGTPTSISSNDATFADLNNAIQIGDKVFNNSNSDIRTVQNISGNTITLDAAPTNAFSYFAKDNRFNTSGVLGYYAEITMTNTSTDKKELYSVGSEVSLSS